LFMCGVYPYTPDALIEVDFDGGRVWVRFADWFRRPLRLTPQEGLALVAAAKAALELPGGANPALARAVSKLETVLGAGGTKALDIELGSGSQELLSVLQAAVEQRRKLRIDYYSFGRDETAQRVLQPWRVFSSEGHWYLLAWCESAGGRRLFRADRVRFAELLDESFEPPADAGPLSIYQSRPEDPLVVLELAPAARWVVGQYPHEGVTDLGDGRVQVRFRASSTAWLERLLLRAGRDALVISGAEGVAQAAARRVLNVYGKAGRVSTESAGRPMEV